MAEYTVHFVTTMTVTVTVDADNADDAIEKAWDEGPGSICGQCSGSWAENWGRDTGDLEPESVVDESGKTVWPATAGA